MFFVQVRFYDWGRATHICVSELTIIGSDIGLAPGRRQAIIWTNARVLVIGPLGRNFREIITKIHTFSFKKMHSNVSRKMSAILSQPQWVNSNQVKPTASIVVGHAVSLLPDSWHALISGGVVYSSAMMTSSNGNIFRVTGEYPAHIDQWRGALMFSLICAWINAWVNNGDAGDLRRHHTHYDITVM